MKPSIILFAAGAAALRVPFGAPPTVQPIPPKGFTWAEGSFEGKVVPTKPAAPAKSPAPPAPVVAAPSPPAPLAATPETAAPAAPAPATVGFLGRIKGIFTRSKTSEAVLGRIKGIFTRSKPSEAEPVAAPPAAMKVWPVQGGSTKPGAYKAMAAPRELWTPPNGWNKPTKAVSSWYDLGTRLTAPVASWYDKGLRLAPSGWGLVPMKGTYEMVGAMSVPQACAFMAMSPSVPFEEKKAFLLSKGVSPFVVTEAACTAPDTALVL